MPFDDQFCLSGSVNLIVPFDKSSGLIHSDDAIVDIARSATRFSVRIEPVEIDKLLRQTCPPKKSVRRARGRHTIELHNIHLDDFSIWERVSLRRLEQSMDFRIRNRLPVVLLALYASKTTGIHPLRFIEGGLLKGSEFFDKMELMKKYNFTQPAEGSEFRKIKKNWMRAQEERREKLQEDGRRPIEVDLVESPREIKEALAEVRKLRKSLAK